MKKDCAVYWLYYRSRHHLSLDKDSPDPRPMQTAGMIIAIPEVGGLPHRYERRAGEDGVSLDWVREVPVSRLFVCGHSSRLCSACVDRKSAIHLKKRALRPGVSHLGAGGTRADGFSG
jgi:hypothetical protein